MQRENLSAQCLRRKGETNGNWHQRISCHGKNENVRSPGPAQSAGVKPTYISSSSRQTWTMSRIAWLNSAFQKLSRTKSQTFPFPCLLKGYSINVNYSLHLNDPSQVSIHWWIVLWQHQSIHTTLCPSRLKQTWTFLFPKCCHKACDWKSLVLLC